MIMDMMPRDFWHCMKRLHEVILIAPDREKSGVSHGITLNEPMRLNRVTLKIHNKENEK